MTIENSEDRQIIDRLDALERQVALLMQDKAFWEPRDPVAAVKCTCMWLGDGWDRKMCRASTHAGRRTGRDLWPVLMPEPEPCQHKPRLYLGELGYPHVCRYCHKPIKQVWVDA